MKIDKLNDEFIVDCTNNSKEERQQVCKFLVDNRNYQKSYLEEDYPVIVCNKKQNNSNWDSLEKYYDWVDSKKDIPIYTFGEFEEMYLKEKLVLPKQWVVKVTKENADTLTEWKLKISNGYYNENAKYYTFISSSGGGMNYPTTYPVITFEQFKKYVLKENNIENKKIIEYRVKSEFSKLSKVLFEQCNQDSKGGHGRFDVDSNVKDFYEKAGVLDIWFEPVYEEEFKVGDWVTFWSEIDKKLYSSKIKEWTPHNYCKLENGLEPFKHLIKKATPEEIEKASKTIVKMYSSNKGEFEIEVVNEKAYYRPENKHLPKEWIRDIINSYGNILIQKNVINPYNVEISSINVGCYHNCKKEDWENVYKLLK